MKQRQKKTSAFAIFMAYGNKLIVLNECVLPKQYRK